jgi:predicted TIM-barrel fold metal-dependent hydrolase
MAHSGGIHLLQTMLYTRSVKNIFYDISFTCNYLYTTSVKQDMVHFLKYTANRVMFGSDYPDFTVHEAAKTVLELAGLAFLSEDQKERIFYQNAADMYFGGKL